MKKNLMYNFNDFTEKEYKKILIKLKTHRKFIFFNQIKKMKNDKTKQILWRHDVDISPQRALKLAKIENTLNVNSTFFFQTGSIFYNIFEEEIIKIIKKILNLKHQVGLHIDLNQYNIKNKRMLENFLDFEKLLFKKLFNFDVKAFSFHNAGKLIKKYNEFKYSNLINACGSSVNENFKYCSDSNGYWRFERLNEFINKNKNHNIHVLTHPIWWQSEAMSPYKRVNRAILGRKKRVLNKYLNVLKNSKRKNIK